MLFTEAIRETVVRPEVATRPEATSKLRRVISRSGIVSSLEELKNQIPVLQLSKEIIEEGRKMVITTNWRNNIGNCQVVISLTENSVSLIGDRNNYERFEGKDIREKQKIQESMVKVFANPLRF